MTGFEANLYMLRENTRRRDMISGGEFLYTFLKFVVKSLAPLFSNNLTQLVYKIQNIF